MRYNYCPVCGSPATYERIDQQQIPVCHNPSCGFIFWQNSKPCVSAFITDNQDRVLLTVRGREPYKDKLDLPGGFLHAGESVIEGTKREIQEELGIEIELGNYLGAIADQYGADGDYTLTICHEAKITRGKPRAADDVADITWVDPKTVTASQLAFANNHIFIEAWLARRKHDNKFLTKIKKRFTTEA